MACGEEGTGRLSEPHLIVDAALASWHAATGRWPDAMPSSLRARRSSRSMPCGSSPTDRPASRATPSPRRLPAAARVTLVSGPVTVPPPPQVDLVRGQTARQMLAACEAALPADLASVPPPSPTGMLQAAPTNGKIKKQSENAAAAISN